MASREQISAQRQYALSEQAQRILQNLKSKQDETRENAAKQLRQLVEEESRQLNGEAFNRFMSDLNRRIFEFVSSTDPAETMGGILAIDELIDVSGEENEAKIIRFANYLRKVFQQAPVSADTATLVMAAKALGHLARAGGTLTADFVEFEVRRALEWLQGDRNEVRRHAAVLVLRQLAQNAPTLFYVHVATFFEHIWTALRDPKVFFLFLFLFFFLLF